MKKAALLLAFLFVLVQLSVATDPGWPRQISKPAGTLVYYQPQVDDWESFKTIDWRTAFSLTPQGGKAVVGVARMHADTEVFQDADSVVLSNITVKSIDFPALDAAKAQQMTALVKSFVPQSTEISLRRLVASVNAPPPTQGVAVKNDPPQIFISYTPALLIHLDGEPVKSPIEHTKLDVIVNTSWRLFFDRHDSQYLLYNGVQWMRSPALDQGWTVVSKLPEDFTKLAALPGFSDLKQAVPPSANTQPVPTVFFSKVPAELIVFKGQPSYELIPGTKLAWAVNADSPVFFYNPTSTIYYLTAGRWFSASSLQGPWAFATPELPADFANIPATMKPVGEVLGSVPGTPEAKDALLLAQIPTTVTVTPAAAQKVNVTYAGQPEFAPIEGTSLQYATNTADKVIKVGDLYYLCFQGIWFLSSSPQGPWQTASSVPQQVYSIPPSSPVYNVTYVTQSTTPDGNVQASYTAGYLGAFAMGTAMGAVLASGTGYYYPPYYGYGAWAGAYYPRAYTYGSYPYYNTMTGAYGYRGGTYGMYGSAGWGASYNPYTGTYARGGAVTTPYGSAAAGQAYNPYTGAYGATRQGSNAYSQWGSSVVSKGGQTAYTQHYSTARGSVGSMQTSGGWTAAASRSEIGSTAVASNSSGDMYAGHDGNVYKNTGSGWQKYDNGGWNSVSKPSESEYRPAQQAPSAQGGLARGSEGWGTSGGMQGLSQESANRERGAFQSQGFENFQRSGEVGGGGRSWGGGGWGGGGRSWGGGGGRGRR